MPIYLTLKELKKLFALAFGAIANPTETPKDVDYVVNTETPARKTIDFSVIIVIIV